MAAQRVPLGRGDVSTHLEGSGVLTKQIDLGKSVTDRGNSQREGPEARVSQNVQGRARGPRGLVWRGHRGSHMRESQRGNGGPFPSSSIL